MAPAHKVCRYNAVLNLPHNLGDTIAICSLCLTVKYASKDITQKTSDLVRATLIMMIGVAMH
jgi:riboflavin synthase alpha subunit